MLVGQLFSVTHLTMCALLIFINRCQNPTQRHYIPNLKVGMIPVGILNWPLTLAREHREDRMALTLSRLSSHCVIDSVFAKAADGMMLEVGGG